MKILVFNWRDISHPWAGGAELNIHEQAKRWVQAGHQVTLFCGAYEGCSNRDNIDGIEIIRRGSRLSVYLWAFLYYIRYWRGKFDIIVDIENGIPFFTPLYIQTPKVCIAHHVHTEQFRKEFPPILAKIGIFIESGIMPLVYKNIPFIIISQSSCDEFIQIGIKPDKISIVYCGLDHNQYKPGQEKTTYPSLICVGRLMSYKRVDLLIEMMPAIIKEIPDAVLHIVGSGIVENNLKQLTEQLGVENNVVFTGFMNDADKVGFLQRAWVFVIASMKEGWGLVAIEANACGTPVIGFNVPGLCEAIDNPHSGILVECNDDFIKNTIRILKDSKFRESLSQGGIIHANKFNWDKTAAESLNILVDICNEKKASVTAKL